ncbi:hypothetical protein ACFFX0_02555 [Citricoccus parietis]|uniref:Uncharacterized protein n=1 Tax=Citricoccus parietis TaxID=592307 RepID=A0ABV5FTW4_9MICC
MERQGRHGGPHGPRRLPGSDDGDRRQSPMPWPPPTRSTSVRPSSWTRASPLPAGNSSPTSTPTDWSWWMTRTTSMPPSARPARKTRRWASPPIPTAGTTRTRAGRCRSRSARSRPPASPSPPTWASWRAPRTRPPPGWPSTS